MRESSELRERGVPDSIMSLNLPDVPSARQRCTLELHAVFSKVDCEFRQRATCAINDHCFFGLSCFKRRVFHVNLAHKFHLFPAWNGAPMGPLDCYAGCTHQEKHEDFVITSSIAMCTMCENLMFLNKFEVPRDSCNFRGMLQKGMVSFCLCLSGQPPRCARETYKPTPPKTTSTTRDICKFRSQYWYSMCVPQHGGGKRKVPSSSHPGGARNKALCGVLMQP